MRRGALPLAGVVAVAVAAASATADEAGSRDPWRGVSRDAMVEALGEPDAIRERGAGSTMIYRLHEIDPAAPPPAGMTFVEVAGVGLLGRFAVAPTVDDELRIEPTAIDEDGRLVSGGVERSRSASGRYDTETGTFERDWQPGAGDGTLGPATLRFRLDSAGRVVEWTVKPRRLRRTAEPG